MELKLVDIDGECSDLGNINRTIVELKRCSCSIRSFTAYYINRTIVELKQINDANKQVQEDYINRTIVELKLIKLGLSEHG